jgi:hypothetical protein
MADACSTELRERVLNAYEPGKEGLATIGDRVDLCAVMVLSWVRPPVDQASFVDRLDLLLAAPWA